MINLIKKRCRRCLDKGFYYPSPFTTSLRIRCECQDMKKQLKLPPREFSNLMNDVCPCFDFTNWQLSPEWKIFKAGYKFGIDEVKDTDFGLSSRE